MSYKIENEVLLTDDGIAFLAGGSHRIMDYIQGTVEPNQDSIAAFWANIRARATFSRMASAKYAHVIFPDKQTILSDQFPIRPFVCLGNTYMKQAPEQEREKVIYPVDTLKAYHNSFYPLDTHMTDEGSLVVLGEMLKSVGVDAADTLAGMANQITQKETTFGDLGSKLNPQRTQDVLKLRRAWPHKGFHGFTGRNDGMVDILLNPEAPVKKTVLLFGDSFFRMMLPHLNAVFSRVICMRTRFYHQDVVRLVTPDIIFTGNVERYLSNVTPDREAHPFFLYSLAPGAEQPSLSPEFVAAYRSMLSPNTQYARKFFSSVEYIRP
ncbi:MAG: hypothetical protein ACSHXB_02780 [Sulfitobacter sp.]